MKRLAVASGLVAIVVIAACADLSGLTGGAADSGVENALDDAAARIDGADSADARTTDADFTEAEAGLVDVTAVDASGCCDCDNDGFSVDASCKQPIGDCDDTIAAIRPDASFALNSTWPSALHKPAFDWDCDGFVTKQLSHDFTCQNTPLNCTGEGFQNDPACGVSAPYFKCVATGVGCVPQTTGSVTQACR